MQTLRHADAFFLISTIGFIILWIFLAVALVYLIRLLKNLSKTAKAIEESAEDVKGEIRFFLERIEESAIFRFLFRRKRRKSEEKK